jgi:hypothetical protein
MRQLQTSGRPGFRLPGAAFAVVAALGLVACSLDNVPPELKPMVDSRLPRAGSIAEIAAEQCVAHKETGGPAPTVSPAAGTSLAEELEVVEILVRCDWEEGKETSPEGGELSFSFPALRRAQQHHHHPSPRLVYDTFVKRGDTDFDRVHVPSRFSDVESSADIVATRPIPGGGTVEVTVATVKR